MKTKFMNKKRLIFLIAFSFLFLFLYSFSFASADITNSSKVAQSINLAQYDYGNYNVNASTDLNIHWYGGDIYYSPNGLNAYISDNGTITEFALPSPYAINSMYEIAQVNLNNASLTYPYTSNPILNSYNETSFFINGNYVLVAYYNNLVGFQNNYTTFIEEYYLNQSWNITSIQNINQTIVSMYSGTSYIAVTGMYMDSLGTNLVLAVTNPFQYLYWYQTLNPYNISSISSNALAEGPTGYSGFVAPVGANPYNIQNPAFSIWFDNNGYVAYIASQSFDYSEVKLSQAYNVTQLGHLFANLTSTYYYASPYYGNAFGFTGNGISNFYDSLGNPYFASSGEDDSGIYAVNYGYTSALSNPNSFYSGQSASSQVLVGNIVNPLLNLFPPASEISFEQQIGTAVIVMFLTVLLLLFAGSSLKDGIHDIIIWIALILLVVEYLFFTSIGYFPVEWLIIIVLALIAIAYFKFKGNSGS